MKSTLPLTFGAVLATLFLVHSGMAQDPPRFSVIGRSSASAPLESSRGSKELPDSIEQIPANHDLDGTNPEPDSTLKASDWAFVAVFEGPCHFAERLNDVARSLVIYEGMQVAVDRTGNYEVSLNAEVPLTPVVVRLQLRVTELVGNERFDHGTITLPPMVIETSQETSDQQPSSTVRIRRTGYSHLLHRLLTANKDSFTDISFSRGGVARFGSIPEAANYSSTRAETTDTTK